MVGNDSVRRSIPVGSGQTGWAARPSIKSLGLAVLLLLLLATRGAQILARDPCVGIADNLDYWRVADPAGIEVNPVAQQGFFVSCQFPTAPAHLASGFSSAALLAWIARHVPFSSAEGRTFELHDLGLLYWSLCSLVLLVSLALRAPPLLVALLGWVLLDPGFLLFFNSLYADPAMLLGVLATLCGLMTWAYPDIAPRHARWAGVLIVGGAWLSGWSKMQYTPFPAIVLGCCLLAVILGRVGRSHRDILLIAVLAVIATTAPLHFFAGDAPRFLDANNYNALFGGIARVARQPAATLVRLGIPIRYAARGGRDYFAAGVTSRDPVLPYVRALSRARLAGAYLLDPHALRGVWKAVDRDLWRAALTREARASAARALADRRHSPRRSSSPGYGHAFRLWPRKRSGACRWDLSRLSRGAPGGEHGSVSIPPR